MARRRRSRSRGRSFFSFANWMNIAIVAVLGYVGIKAWGDKVPAVKGMLDDASDKVAEMGK